MATVVITGTSSGIGLSTALELARAGHTVIGTMRNRAASSGLADAAASEGSRVQIRTLDVALTSRCGPVLARSMDLIDVLVNNAGIECHGSVEELPMGDHWCASPDCSGAALANPVPARRRCARRASDHRVRHLATPPPSRT